MNDQTVISQVAHLQAKVHALKQRMRWMAVPRGLGAAVWAWLATVALGGMHTPGAAIAFKS